MIYRHTVFVVIGIIASCSPRLSLASESLRERKQRLNEMSVVEKEELRHELARFNRLTESERTRLRELDSELSAASDGDRLREIMIRYAAWLRTLNASQRSALLRLPPEKRVSEIKALVEQRERQRFQEMFDYELQPADQKALLVWISALIERDEGRMLKPLSAVERQRLHRIEDRTRRYAALAMAYRARLGEDVRLFEVLQPTESDFGKLGPTLSPTAREILDETRDEAEREKLLQNWVRAALESRLRPPASPEQLRRFMQQLSVEDRERLESLPKERMRFELQRLYMRRHFDKLPNRNGNER